MKHVFKATRLGWEKEQEGISFDSAKYSKEEAEAQFKPYDGVTQRGYPYTGYEYDGQKYHDYTYVGEYEDDKLPRNDNDVLEHLLRKKEKDTEK